MFAFPGSHDGQLLRCVEPVLALRHDDQLRTGFCRVSADSRQVGHAVIFAVENVLRAVPVLYRMRTHPAKVVPREHIPFPCGIHAALAQDLLGNTCRAYSVADQALHIHDGRHEQRFFRCGKRQPRKIRPDAGRAHVCRAPVCSCVSHHAGEFGCGCPWCKFLIPVLACAVIRQVDGQNLCVRSHDFGKRQGFFLAAELSVNEQPQRVRRLAVQHRRCVFDEELFGFHALSSSASQFSAHQVCSAAPRGRISSLNTTLSLCIGSPNAGFSCLVPAPMSRYAHGKS